MRLRWSVVLLAVAGAAGCEGPISDLPAVPGSEGPGAANDAGSSSEQDGDAGAPDAGFDGCVGPQDGGRDGASDSQAPTGSDAASQDAAVPGEAGCSD